MTPTPSAPPADNLSEQQEAVSTFLSALPHTSQAFTRFDPNYPPCSENFALYLANEEDGKGSRSIGTEKTRCLIRALKAKGPPRKRALPLQTSSQVAKKPRWSNLEREKKQACLRVALSAACQGKGDTGILGELRKAWRENPRKKQVVDKRVRRALCDSLETWSLAQLSEYLQRAGMQATQGRAQLIEAVRSHLAPEE